MLSWLLVLIFKLYMSICIIFNFFFTIEYFHCCNKKNHTIVTWIICLRKNHKSNKIFMFFDWVLCMVFTLLKLSQWDITTSWAMGKTLYSIMVLKSQIPTYAKPKYKGTTNNEVLLFIIYPICFEQHYGLLTYISGLNNLCFFRWSLQNHIFVWLQLCQISICRAV